METLIVAAIGVFLGALLEAKFAFVNKLLGRFGL